MLKTSTKRIDGSTWRKVLEALGIEFFQIRSLPTLGHIKDGYFLTNLGRVWSDTSRQFLKPSATNSNGYLQVKLPTLKQDAETLYIHRLVALRKYQRSIGNHEQVRHLDGDKLNNSASNICLGTAADNAMDRVAHGRSGARYTDDQVRHTRAFGPLVGTTAKERRHGFSKAKIMKRSGVNSDAIAPIASFRRRGILDVPLLPDGAEGIIIPFDFSGTVSWDNTALSDGEPVSNFEALRAIAREHPKLWEKMLKSRKKRPKPN